MKATLKNIAAALAVLALTVTVLVVIDAGITADVSAETTYVRVCVVDLDGNALHNAQVTVNGVTFNTDNKGLSPSIELDALSNCYDSLITEWGTVTVSIAKSGYVPAVAFNCVVYAGQTRKVTIKLYPVDGSDLPYVTYVESPPDEYVRNITST